MTSRVLFSIPLLIFGFLAGAYFVHSKHWPYHFLRQLGVGSALAKTYSDQDTGLFSEIFSDELVAKDYLLQEIVDRATLIDTVNMMVAPRADIRGIGEALRLNMPLSTKRLPKESLILASVSYALDAQNREAHAYMLGGTGKPAKGEPDCATLIIPGSGRDQGLAIAHNDARNYHAGILEPYSSCQIFVLIKPNEDYLSIVRNGRKLTENAYINHLIGMGSSYSARYITDAIALTKALKRQFSRTIVTGLSQGGTAAVLVGIEARPNLTVAASGLFEIARDLGYGGHNSSLLFPGLQRPIFKDWIPQKLRSTDDGFLILSGRRENGLAGQDAREGWTCNWLSGMPRVTCLTHPGGHIYPSEAVGRYLEDHFQLRSQTSE